MTVRKSALLGERLLHLEGTDEDDSAVIRSVMYYPENAKNRASYLQYSRLLVSLAGAPEPFDRPLSLSDDVLAALTRRATIVGALLACYQLLNHFKESTGVFARPSMDKAIHVVRGFAQYAGRFRDDSVIHTSKRTLNKYWSEYRSVAPLWAAMWFNDENSPYAFMSPDAQFNSRRNIELFIGVAKGLRAFGTTFTDIHGEALLDDKSTWKFPASVLTKTFPAQAPPSERLVEIMKTYKPRKSEYVF